MREYFIEDIEHHEIIHAYASLEEAHRELERLAALAWDQEPNRAPCMSWRTCGRDYVLVEHDDADSRQKDRRTPQFSISAAGVRPPLRRKRR